MIQFNLNNRNTNCNQILRFGILLMLFLPGMLLAQSQTGVIGPDNQPEQSSNNDAPISDSITPDAGLSISTSNLVRGCKAVETGDTAAFKTVLIPHKNYVIPIIDAHAEWMPPEPANPDATIAGIDSDFDCVRDDIERYIGKLFRNNDQQRKRKYLFEYAKWLGLFIKINHWSLETTRTIYQNIYKAAECVRRIHGNNKTTFYLLDNVFANFHNTHNRSVRYIKNNGKLGGWVTREKIRLSCP